MNADTTLIGDIKTARDAAHAVWQRAHAEDADRTLTDYLAVAYDQAERACKAVGIEPIKDRR